VRSIAHFHRKVTGPSFLVPTGDDDRVRAAPAQCSGGWCHSAESPMLRPESEVGPHFWHLFRFIGCFGRYGVGDPGHRMTSTAAQRRPAVVDLTFASARASDGLLVRPAPASPLPSDCCSG